MNIPYGNNLKLTVEGGSHDEFIALELKNFPAGFRPDYEELLSFMQRRAPGRSAYSTARREPDRPEFVSGLTDGLTDGSTIRIIIRSLDAHSSDYHFNDTPRPSHADFAAVMKYGPQADLRGGGKFSGRLTALTCAGGRAVSAIPALARSNGSGSHRCRRRRKRRPVRPSKSGSGGKETSRQP